jgi:cell division protein FtsB
MTSFNQKLIFGILFIALASFIFSGCEKHDEASATTNQSLEIAAYRAQIEYYSDLTNSLQEQIINIKEERFITEHEYEQRIDELENEIKTLFDKIKYLATGNQASEPNDTESSGFICQSIENATYATTDLTLNNKFLYEETPSGIIITKYIGDDRQVTIPAQIGGIPVTSIGDSAFKDSKITTVSIPSSVKEIGWFAFSGCSLLANINISSSVTYIGYGAFDFCPTSMLIKCDSGSYTEAYAISWGLRYLAE